MSEETKFKYGLAISGDCEKCLMPNNLDHMIIKCTKFKEERAKYKFLYNETSLEEVLKKIKNENYKKLVKFSKTVAPDI